MVLVNIRNIYVKYSNCGPILYKEITTILKINFWNCNFLLFKQIMNETDERKLINLTKKFKYDVSIFLS